MTFPFAQENTESRQRLAALELCLSSAEALDAGLAALTPDLVKQIEEHAKAASTVFRMNRSLHRNDHLKDIETLVAQGK